MQNYQLTKTRTSLEHLERSKPSSTLLSLHKCPSTLSQLTALTSLKGNISLDPFPITIATLTNLQSLSLDARRLQSPQLPEAYSRLVALSSLHIVHITELAIPDFVGALTNLKDLAFHAPVIIFPPSLRHLRKLKRLSIPFGDVGLNPGSYGLDIRPEYLDGIIEQTDEALQLRHLRDLALSLALDQAPLPHALRSSTSLRHLYLYWRGRSFEGPHEVSPMGTGLCNLQALHLNKIYTLPRSLAGFSSLRRLHLKRLNHCNLPHTFGDLSSLQQLFLESLETLESIPDSIGRIQGLEDLFIVDCSQLQQLPDSLSNCNSLKTLLFVGECTISNSQHPTPHHRQFLPNSLGELPLLQNLVLANTRRITDLPRTLGRMTSLQVLALFNLQLTHIDSVFHGMRNLKFLLFDKLPITHISPALGNLTALIDLHLPRTMTSLSESCLNLRRLRRLSCNALLTSSPRIQLLTASGLNDRRHPKLRILPTNVKIRVPSARYHSTWNILTSKQFLLEISYRDVSASCKPLLQSLQGLSFAEKAYTDTILPL